ncbi:MAG: hypothetical protein U0168_26165 [Nannocystaceae bacterium]
MLVPGPISRPSARDDVALDRRGGPRPRMVLDEIDPPVRAVDRFTAATHQPLPLLLGVAVPRIGDTPGGWLIARGLSWADGGALLLALDPSAPPIDPVERIARRAWADLWRHVHACVPASPLQVVSACVRVPTLLAAIAAARPDAALAVELLPLLLTSPADARTAGDAPTVTPVAAPTAPDRTPGAAGRSPPWRARGRDGPGRARTAARRDARRTAARPRPRARAR